MVKKQMSKFKTSTVHVLTACVKMFSPLNGYIYLFKGKKLCEDFIMADSLMSAAEDAQDVRLVRHQHLVEEK